MSPDETPFPEELARVERFIAAYNVVDDFLQSQMHSPQTFRTAVDIYAKRHPWWRDAENLRLYAAMRNFMVHEKTQPFDYPCVPSEAAVRDIEAIRSRLVRPSRLADEFLHPVATLGGAAPLVKALEMMHAKGHSRFPVYEGSRFLGLLTENGIARALAEKAASGEILDLEIPVRTILPRETRRRYYRFTVPDTLVSQVAFWFHENTFLETVLVTENGAETGRLRGIVTRGDVAGRVE